MYVPCSTPLEEFSHNIIRRSFLDALHFHRAMHIYVLCITFKSCSFTIRSDIPSSGINMDVN